MRITSIQHLSVDDGPGIWTTVFTSGCNLHCNWCHNPEAMIVRPRILFDREKCIHFLACVSVCSNGVLDAQKHPEEY